MFYSNGKSSNKTHCSLIPYPLLSVVLFAWYLRAVVAVVKHPQPNASWEEKGLFRLTTLRSHSSLRKVRAGTQGKEPGDRTWSRGHGGKLFTNLFSLHKQFGTTCPGVALFFIRRPLPHQSYTPQTCLWAILQKHFLHYDPLFPEMSRFVSSTYFILWRQNQFWCAELQNKASVSVSPIWQAHW